MKAIKFASLTVLAAAISAQAAADFYITKGADIKVSGSMYTEAVVDLTAEKVYVTNDNGDADQVFAKLNLNNKVFDGTIVVEEIGGNELAFITWADKDEDKVVDNDELELKKVNVGPVKLVDVTVTDGNIKFGQVGSLGNTHEYFGLHEDVSQESFGVDAGIRYSNLAGVKGLAAQVEGAGSANRSTTNDFGLGLAYSSEVASGVTLHANAAVRQMNDLNADDGVKTHVGLGVTAKVAEGVTVKAVVNNQNVAGASATDLGAEVVVVTGPVTSTAAVVTKMTDKDTDPLHALAKVAFAQDGISAHAQYKFKTTEADKDQTGDEVEAKLGYSLTQSAWTYAASTTFSASDILDENEDDAVGEKLATEVSAAYKSAVGATYTVAFNNETLAKNDQNKLTFKAAYKF